MAVMTVYNLSTWSCSKPLFSNPCNFLKIIISWTNSGWILAGTVIDIITFEIIIYKRYLHIMVIGKIVF